MGWVCVQPFACLWSRDHYCETLSAAVRGPSLPTVSSQRSSRWQRVWWEVDWGRRVSWGTQGQAEGLCPAEPRSPRQATHWPAQALKQQWTSPPSSPLRPNSSGSLCESMEASATGVKVTALTSFGLSIRVSKIGPASISFLSLGGVQRSGLSCKDTVHRYFRSTSVMGLFSKKGNCCELGIHLMGICYHMYSCWSCANDSLQFTCQNRE